MTKNPKLSLAETHPDLCMEWDTEGNPSHSPSDVSRGSNVKVNWICRICHHRWSATVHNRSSGRGCPECKNRTISQKLRTPKFGEDLATQLPALAEQWHPTKNGELKPENVFPKSNKKAWWRCNDCDHEWSAVISSRSSGHGCPECKKRAISKKLRIPKVGKDLATQKPELAKQWHPTKNGVLTPKDVKTFSHDNIWWLCENGLL
jgi:rubrerythrin